jgi:hypothetical protein
MDTFQVEIAKNLLDILDYKAIPMKTGLTIEDLKDKETSKLKLVSN